MFSKPESGGFMKAFLASLAMLFVFAVAPASAGDGHSSEEYSDGCGHYKKWEDT